MKQLSLVLLCVAFAGMATAGGAEEVSHISTSLKSRAVRSDEQAILVLQVAKDAAGKERERRFVAELRMTLDELPVKFERPKDPDFGGLILGEQIVRVRSLLDRHGAAAATWLSDITPDMLLLHLVAVSSGRALVRLVETDLTQGAETSLAMAARELLGTAYLFDPPPGGEKSPIAPVVDQVRRRAADGYEEDWSVPKPPVTASVASSFSADKNEGNWSVLAGVVSSGGLWGHEGPSLMPGGTMALDRRLDGGLRGRIGLAILGGPLGTIQDGDSRGWALQPGVGASFLWDFHQVAFGPSIDVDARLSNILLQAGRGPEQRFFTWLVHAWVGMDLRLRVTSDFSVLFGCGMGATPQQLVIHRQSDYDRVVLATPFVSWKAFLGIELRPGRTKKSSPGSKPGKE